MDDATESASAFAFTPEYIKERFLEHWDLAEGFSQHFLECYDLPIESVEIDSRRMKFAIDSAYQDIARYKQYHQNNPHDELLDCTKRCAFLLKWLMRFKPIQTVNGAFESEALDFVELINECFVLYIFEIHLSDEIKTNVVLSTEKIRQFAYDLMYRQISAVDTKNLQHPKTTLGRFRSWSYCLLAKQESKYVDQRFS